MSKFNVVDKRGLRSPIQSEATPSGVTHEGAPGFARDAKTELFLLAVSNMVGEDSFYEKASDRDDRYAGLVRQVAVQDAGWTLDFLRWLRGDGNMRSASLVGAAEAVKARLDAAKAGPVPNGARNRQIVDAVLQRADEPGELLAYWTSRYGRAIPKPVKRGVGDAVQRMYTEFNLLKYDTASHGFRFGDVIDLVHPNAKAPWQGDLFRHALDRRHGRGNEVPIELPMLTANALLRLLAAAEPEVLLNPDKLREAGFTWEDALSLAGPKVDKARLWSALIPSMGYMALLRNLRNFDEAGLSDDAAEQVAKRLADPEQVAKSRQFPMRFLSAYKAVSNLRWAHALDKALSASLANVPTLKGRTLILVDLSGSMADRLSAKSDLTRAEAAKVFGAALAMRAEQADLVGYDTRAAVLAVPRGGSLLTLVRSFPNLGGGTATAAVAQALFKGHDRVVIVTDEQASHYYGGDPGAVIPTNVPLYTWNLAGYKHGHAASGGNRRHTFGGLTDAAFRVMSLLENHQHGVWPWQVPSNM